MKSLNGLTIYNATPHSITFQCPRCDGTGCRDCEPFGSGTVTVEPDRVVSAEVVERPADDTYLDEWFEGQVEFVITVFEPTDEGRAVIAAAFDAGADLIVGSILAAQAYPGEVFAMVPAPGYERVPPAEKRMRAYKFTVFEE